MLKRSHKAKQEQAEKIEKANRSGKSDKKLLSILGDGIQTTLTKEKTPETSILLRCVVCRSVILYLIFKFKFFKEKHEAQNYE